MYYMPCIYKKNLPSYIKTPDSSPLWIFQQKKIFPLRIFVITLKPVMVKTSMKLIKKLWKKLEILVFNGIIVYKQAKELTPTKPKITSMDKKVMKKSLSNSVWKFVKENISWNKILVTMPYNVSKNWCRTLELGTNKKER